MRILMWILIINSMIVSILLFYSLHNPICPEQKQIDCKYTNLDRIEDYLVEGKLKINRISISCDKSSFNNGINCYSFIEINEGNDTKRIIKLDDDNFKGIVRKVVYKLNLEIP